jgi:hypothetical protein
MTSCAFLPTLIQYSTRIPSQSNKAREKNRRDSNKEGRSQIIPICRWHVTIVKRFHQKTTRSDKHFWHCTKA